MFRLQLYMHSIEEYTCVSHYIGASPYILCQIAAAQSELKEHDSAIISFQKIRKKDPYRIEQVNLILIFFTFFRCIFILIPSISG